MMNTADAVPELVVNGGYVFVTVMVTVTVAAPPLSSSASTVSVSVVPAKPVRDAAAVISPVLSSSANFPSSFPSVMSYVTASSVPWEPVAETVPTTRPVSALSRMDKPYEALPKVGGTQAVVLVVADSDGSLHSAA